MIGKPGRHERPDLYDRPWRVTGGQSYDSWLQPPDDRPWMECDRCNKRVPASDYDGLCRDVLCDDCKPRPCAVCGYDEDLRYMVDGVCEDCRLDLEEEALASA